MKIETLSLNLPYEKLDANPAEVSLTGYILENFKNYRQDETRPAVIICPGGGYGAISEHETAPIAEAYIGAGISAFVLLYSIAPVRYPAQYIELCEAIATVRRHSAQWNIDENKIFVTGYSAGG
ncbi:MAG: alpha/beta hydrolase, partial [Angelakisella sp.]